MREQRAGSWPITDDLPAQRNHLGRLSPGHRRRPPLHARSGYGLWLMGRLCDELVIAQSAGRSSVRLRMRTGDDADLPR